MLNPLHDATRRVLLILSSFALFGSSVQAQMTSGPGLSSGTGQGTGSGGTTGVLRNRSGSMSGVGPGSVSAPGSRGRSLSPLPGQGERRDLVPFGPGVDVTFPDDPYLLPFVTLGDRKSVV